MMKVNPVDLWASREMRYRGKHMLGSKKEGQRVRTPVSASMCKTKTSCLFRVPPDLRSKASTKRAKMLTPGSELWQTLGLENCET